MFFISIAISLFYFIFSVFINVDWIHDISCYLGYPLAIYLVLFIALVPGFIYVFMLISLLHKEKEKKGCILKECDVTVLVPVYNSKKFICKTIDSIKNQTYDGNIHIIVIDDGSTDDSLELLKSMNCDSNITLLETCHREVSLLL